MSNIIPYSQIEEIRRYNQNIENTCDEMERMLYQAGKMYSMEIPHEKMKDILEQSKKEIYVLAQKKKQERLYKFVKIFIETISVMAVVLLIYEKAR